MVDVLSTTQQVMLGSSNTRIASIVFPVLYYEYLFLYWDDMTVPSYCT